MSELPLTAGSSLVVAWLEAEESGLFYIWMELGCQSGHWSRSRGDHCGQHPHCSLLTIQLATPWSAHLCAGVQGLAGCASRFLLILDGLWGRESGTSPGGGPAARPAPAAPLQEQWRSQAAPGISPNHQCAQAVPKQPDDAADALLFITSANIYTGCPWGFHGCFW